MRAHRWTERLARPLSWPARAALGLAALLALAPLKLPLWTMSFESNQYPDPLSMEIYADHLEGQRTPNRDDLKEINSLNHYIGMRALSETDFPEFVWLPLALVALAAIALRAAAVGTLRDALDATVISGLFGLYSVRIFYLRLYQYGHELAADAPIKVAGFTPPIFGRVKIANFWVESYPGAGSWLLGAGLALIAAACLWSLLDTRRAPATSGVPVAAST